MPSIKETIASLDALREKSKKSGKRLVHSESFNEWRVTTEDWNGEPIPAQIIFDKDEPIAYEMEENIADYTVALHNNFPSLRQAALDGERYREAGEALAEAVEEITGFVCSKCDDERVKKSPRLSEQVLNGECYRWQKQRDVALLVYRQILEQRDV